MAGRRHPVRFPTMSFVSAVKSVAHMARKSLALYTHSKKLNAYDDSLDAICPNTNPLDIGFNSITQIAEMMGLNFAECNKHNMVGSCPTVLNFTEGVAGASRNLTYLIADNIASFTESNTAMVTNGPGTVLSPLQGDKFKWLGYRPIQHAAHLLPGEGPHDTPTYTVTAASATPSIVEVDVTRVEDITPSPTMMPSYTLNVRKQIHFQELLIGCHEQGGERKSSCHWFGSCCHSGRRALIRESSAQDTRSMGVSSVYRNFSWEGLSTSGKLVYGIMISSLYC